MFDLTRLRYSEKAVRRLLFSGTAAVLLLIFSAAISSADVMAQKTEDSDKTVTLRVCSWEEYIDEGDWDKSEEIHLPHGDIMGKNSMIHDFEDWYRKTYGVSVRVEYSTFGTNEDLYNMLTLGDTYDLICPSEYMFMKLIGEHKVQPLSKSFFDENDVNNFYIRGVSPYLKNIFESHSIGGEPWSKYAAGYMWGVTGIVYNPALMTRSEASTWSVLVNPRFRKKITIKDSVRECYFAAAAALNHDLLTDKSFCRAKDYKSKLEETLNDTSTDTIKSVQGWLQKMKDNVYSFEVDSGKSDMVTGKVAANYQWSGDAVYSMDQAEEDGISLEFAVPREASNIYFDGWVMLKAGVAGNKERQKAAEAFINFLSRPDNAIRNMYYIGYTSFISGGNDPMILEYLKERYEAGSEEKNTVKYDLSYFFTGNESRTDPSCVITVPENQTRRQLGAQYPSTETIRRTSIMQYFNDKKNREINSMWVNVRCYNIKDMSWWGWCLTAGFFAGIVFLAAIRVKRKGGFKI